MYNLLTLALVVLTATLPFTTALVATKSCPCYTATITQTPEVCPLCIPAQCLVYPTITTTIPGPNPTCTTTSTRIISTGCVCGGDTCPTAWETVTGKFTCKRGGTKQTNIAGGDPGVPVETGDASGSVTTVDGSVTTTVEDAGTTGMMSILPIETLVPVEGA